MWCTTVWGSWVEIPTSTSPNAAQFCQVAMLPQGDFAAFLRAGAEDRRKVLEKLFATEIYAAYPGWAYSLNQGDGYGLRVEILHPFDGGYYLIGMKKPIKELFTDIPFGTGDTLQKTLMSARRASIRVSLLEWKRDVNTGDAWRGVAKTLTENKPVFKSAFAF